jgi:hypothetical protein
MCVCRDSAAGCRWLRVQEKVFEGRTQGHFTSSALPQQQQPASGLDYLVVSYVFVWQEEEEGEEWLWQQQQTARRG